MRHFAALLLIVLTSLHANPQVSVNAGIQAKQTSTHTNQADGKIQQRPPAAASDSIDSSQTRKSTPDQRDSQDRAYRVDIVSQPTSSWTIAYVIIAAVLGILGAGTLWVLIYQTATLGKQVRLQERGLRRWVNTSKWGASLTGKKANGKNVMEIGFKVSNATRAPITLKLVRSQSEDHSETFDVGEAFPENTMLLPGSPYRHTFRILLKDEEFSDYCDKGILLRITGMIFYIDALGDAWTQHFRLLLATSPSSDQTSNYFHVLGGVRTLQVIGTQPLWCKAIDWYVAKIEAMKNGESGNDWPYHGRLRYLRHI